jgi:serine/threonine-protein kinase
MCREAQASRSIRHPRVISVLAAGLHGPPYYVVTPWLPGRTLAARLAEPTGMDLPVVLWIVRQVAEALDGMLDAGWTHGDIKPDNVHISPEGHVTLLDLGFARRVDEACSVDWRYFTGTGSYLAPESVTATTPSDIRSDIYSLGVMFFEMLAGRLPFEGDDLASLIAQHRESAAPSPRRFAPHIPVEVIRLVRQMLSKQPLRRPQSPRELAGRLAELEIQSFSERTLTGGCGV